MKSPKSGAARIDPGLIQSQMSKQVAPVQKLKQNQVMMQAASPGNATTLTSNAPKTAQGVNSSSIEQGMCKQSLATNNETIKQQTFALSA
jgi:hypothetical protein